MFFVDAKVAAIKTDGTMRIRSIMLSTCVYDITKMESNLLRLYCPFTGEINLFSGSNKIVDLVFAIDKSGSVSHERFPVVINFVKKVFTCDLLITLDGQ